MEFCFLQPINPSIRSAFNPSTLHKVSSLHSDMKPVCFHASKTIVPSNDAECDEDSRYILAKANSLHTDMKPICFHAFKTIVPLNDAEFYGHSRYILPKAI